MEEMKCIKKALIEMLYSNINNLEELDTHEVGEIIDMIKDIAETMYYCAASENMMKKDNEM